MYRIAIITASDKGARGERVDVSGQVIREMCQEFATVTSYAVLADERAPLAAAMAAICDQDQADVIFTTGGTGFAPGCDAGSHIGCGGTAWPPAFRRPCGPEACRSRTGPC